MSDLYKKFSPELYEAIYQVDEEQSGMRLDQYCSTFLVSFSRQQIKKKIKDGQIKILGRPFPHRPSVKVYHREKVEVRTPRGSLEDEYWNGEKIQLQHKADIVFEDENILAISKPAYMATHPTGKHLFNCATVYLESIYGHTIHSIHRLDRETSGLLLLAKNALTAQRCSELFEKGLVSKIYFFMAHNKTKESFPLKATERLGILEHYIPRNFNHCFPEASSQGKSAETTFQSLYQDKNYIIGLAFPKTGRQHQIRCHAAAHGLPLIGDKLYNGDPSVFMRFKDGKADLEDHQLMQIPRHALHALALQLPYPQSDIKSLYRTEIPQDFLQWMDLNLCESVIKNIHSKIDQLIQERFN